MVERQLFERDVGRREVAQEIRQRHGTVDAADVGRLVEVGDHRDALHGRQLLHDLAELAQHVDALAAVPVAVDRQQHRRLDLAEAVEHALHAEVRRARRPDGTDRRGGEQADDRFRHVRDDGRDAVAGLHALGAQRLREPRDGVVNIGEGQRAAHLVLAAEDHRGLVVAAAQQVLGVVEPRLGEPLRAGHAVTVDQRVFAARLGDDAAEVPEGRPEIAGRADRPVVERRIVGEAHAVASFDEVGEGGQIGLRPAFGRGGPQRNGHFGTPYRVGAGGVPGGRRDGSAGQCAWCVAA